MANDPRKPVNGLTPPVAGAAPAAPVLPAAQATPADDAANSIIVESPFGLFSDFIVSQNRVLDEVSDLTKMQAENANAPNAILAFSAVAQSFLLLFRSDATDAHNVYQISDTNVAKLQSGLESGSIAFDESAQRVIAERVHGNNPDTKSYSAADIRTAFAENPTRFTHDTRESLLTATAEMPDGRMTRFGVDDLHDGLDQMDSKYDWQGSSDPIAIREFVKDLRQAAEDAREERPVTAPTWAGGPLDYTNAVELKIGGEPTLVPLEIWNGIENKMRETESGYSTGRRMSAISEVFAADPDRLTATGSFAGAAAPASAVAPDVAAPAATPDANAPASEERAPAARPGPPMP